MTHNIFENSTNKNLINNLFPNFKITDYVELLFSHLEKDSSFYYLSKEDEINQSSLIDNLYLYIVFKNLNTCGQKNVLFLTEKNKIDESIYDRLKRLFVHWQIQKSNDTFKIFNTTFYFRTFHQENYLKGIEFDFLIIDEYFKNKIDDIDEILPHIKNKVIFLFPKKKIISEYEEILSSFKEIIQKVGFKNFNDLVFIAQNQDSSSSNEEEKNINFSVKIDLILSCSNPKNIELLKKIFSNNDYKDIVHSFFKLCPEWKGFVKSSIIIDFLIDINTIFKVSCPKIITCEYNNQYSRWQREFNNLFFGNLSEILKILESQKT